MKRVVGICAVLGSLAIGASVANAVVVIDGNLNNGNMDQTAVSSQALPTPEGWVATSDNNDGLSSEPWNNVADAVGDCIDSGNPVGCGVFFKNFHGSATTPFDASMHQDNPGTPGMKYILTGWVGSGPFYSGVDPLSVTSTQFGLEFLDSSSTVIGGQVLELDSTNGLGVPNSNPFGYKQYMAMAVAPPTTVTVRARFSMIDGYPNPGGEAALVTDDYTLICVPEPTSVALGLIGVMGLLGLVRRTR